MAGVAAHTSPLKQTFGVGGLAGSSCLPPWNFYHFLHGWLDRAGRWGWILDILWRSFQEGRGGGRNPTCLPCLLHACLYLSLLPYLFSSYCYKALSRALPSPLLTHLEMEAGKKKRLPLLSGGRRLALHLRGCVWRPALPFTTIKRDIRLPRIWRTMMETEWNGWMEGVRLSLLSSPYLVERNVCVPSITPATCFFSISKMFLRHTDMHRHLAALAACWQAPLPPNGCGWHIL